MNRVAIEAVALSLSLPPSVIRAYVCDVVSAQWHLQVGDCATDSAPLMAEGHPLVLILP